MLVYYTCLSLTCLEVNIRCNWFKCEVLFSVTYLVSTVVSVSAVGDQNCKIKHKLGLLETRYRIKAMYFISRSCQFQY